MSQAAPLYNAAILRLATSIPHQSRLSVPGGTAERRSPVCGSRITVDVTLDKAGRIAELGHEVRACALGQASTHLMSANATGKGLADLESARDALADYLSGKRADPGDWPGLDIFAEARKHSARHASIRLAFEAVAEAARLAGG